MKKAELHRKHFWSGFFGFAILSKINFYRPSNHPKLTPFQSSRGVIFPTTVTSILHVSCPFGRSSLSSFLPTGPSQSSLLMDYYYYCGGGLAAAHALLKISLLSFPFVFTVSTEWKLGWGKRFRKVTTDGQIFPIFNWCFERIVRILSFFISKWKLSYWTLAFTCKV